MMRLDRVLRLIVSLALGLALLVVSPAVGAAAAVGHTCDVRELHDAAPPTARCDGVVLGVESTPLLLASDTAEPQNCRGPARCALLATNCK